jgi:membrane protein
MFDRIRGPEPRNDVQGVWRRVIAYVWDATEAFAEDDITRWAAAMSYFLLLAIAPLVLVANVLIEALATLTGRAASTPTLGAASQSATSTYEQATAWAGTFAPWVIGVLVIVGAVSVFAQFVQATEAIWKIPQMRGGLAAYLRHRGVALAMLGVTAAAFFVAVIVTIAIGLLFAVGFGYMAQLGIDLTKLGLSAWFRALIVFLAAALLFTFSFVVAPDRKIKWKDALPGALVTALLFLLGEQALLLYLGTTKRFLIFGTSQFFVALTVWIYYSAIVVLWGVELTRLLVLDAEERRGERHRLVDADADPVFAECDEDPEESQR